MNLDGVPGEIAFNGYRYHRGEKGVGGWTSKPKDGWYYSFFLKPTGRGARSGESERYVYVPRLTSKRRSRNACRKRAYNLADGKSITAGIKAKAAKTNPPGTGYCMSEKKHVIIADLHEITAKNGRTMLAGKCPDCGCKIQKYGRMIDCPECGDHNEAGANDYICKVCRSKENDG